MGGVEIGNTNGKEVYKRTIFDGYFVKNGSVKQGSGSKLTATIDHGWGNRNWNISTGESDSASVSNIPVEGYDTINFKIAYDITGASNTSGDESRYGTASGYFTLSYSITDDLGNVLKSDSPINKYGSQGSFNSRSYFPWGESTVSNEFTVSLDVTNMQDRKVNISISTYISTYNMVMYVGHGYIKDIYGS